MSSSKLIPASWLYSKHDLFDRLGRTNPEQPPGRVTFLIGSALAAPPYAGSPGVPDARAIVEMIRSTLSVRQMEAFDPLTQGQDAYQAAFKFLVGRKGQSAANAIVREAVSKARTSAELSAFHHSNVYSLSSTTPEEAFRALDSDFSGWYLPPGMEAIGALAANHPDTFGQQILTTNFDPLLEVAIRRAGGTVFRTTLDTDGNLSQSQGAGTHVVHVHGYWHGSDTLHSAMQLTFPRPRLKASLTTLLRSGTFCVTGYGGWDDIFSAALFDVLNDSSASPDVIWCFRAEDPEVSEELFRVLSSGAQRNRVTLYAGIDCHSFWPELRAQWDSAEPATGRPLGDSLRAFESDPLPEEAVSEPLAPGVFERGGQDRPPLVEHFVGRSTELEFLESDRSTVSFLTGIGGAGKSALAAAYFSRMEGKDDYAYYIWRDCKEESEHFERQLATIIAALGNNTVSVFELARQPIPALTQLLLSLSKDKPILVVFDNIDYYVDLESNAIVGGVGDFIRSALEVGSNSRFIFTCRPRVARRGERSVSSLHVEGLSSSETIELFQARGARSPISEIEQANRHTEGHALWLDLLAAQVARNPERRLPDLLHDRSGPGAVIPSATLDSIWGSLKDRERLVLRTLAESVRPATEDELEGYLTGSLKYNQMAKATKYLRGLGLIVVKPQFDGEEFLELHPLIRTYIRSTFPPEERATVIHSIIKFYNGIVAIIKPTNSLRDATEHVDRVSEIAELYIQEKDYISAFRAASRALSSVNASEHPQSFVRLCSILFNIIDWSKHNSLPDFDPVVEGYADLLALLGRFDDARKTMSRFRETIPSKNARYVRYCRIMCNLEWLAGDFRAAIAWGEEGSNLKAQSGADIAFDTSHYLALARRDGGEVDKALSYFLRGAQIEEVLADDTIDEERDGPFYGNIGRCLQFMGQTDNALLCYRKSAFILERSDRHSNVANQAYVRQWIGEVLAAKEDLCDAKAFLEAAHRRWGRISPPKAVLLDGFLEELAERASDCAPMSPDRGERFCRNWIFGRGPAPAVTA